MYDIALTVAACLRSGTRVDVAWVVESELTHADGALALTPGGGRVGELCGGAFDGQLAEHAATLGRSSGRLVTVEVGELEAQAFGLPGAVRARCALVPASALPAELWPALQDRAAVAVRLARDGDEVTGTSLLDPPPETGSVVTDDEVVTVLRPVPTLVLVGGGPVLDTLEQLAAPLGWRTRRAQDAGPAGGLVVGLGPLDMVVLAMHDVDRAGSVLAATLSGRAGYVAAMGSRAMQQARETWLTDRGIAGVERIHTPAGLDLGADGPAEVAVAILAEAIQVAARRRAGMDTP